MTVVHIAQWSGDQALGRPISSHATSSPAILEVIVTPSAEQISLWI
jgi:hypothetical protein